MFRLLTMPPPRLPPELGPPDLSDLLQDGLAKTPGDRPQTTDELIAELQRIIAPFGAGQGHGECQPAVAAFHQSSTVVAPELTDDSPNEAAPTVGLPVPPHVAGKHPTTPQDPIGTAPTTVRQALTPAQTPSTAPVATGGQDRGGHPKRTRHLVSVLVPLALLLAGTTLALGGILPLDPASSEGSIKASAATVDPTSTSEAATAPPTSTTNSSSTTTSQSTTTTARTTTTERQSDTAPDTENGGPPDSGSKPLPEGAYTISGPTVWAAFGSASISFEAVTSAGGPVTVTGVSGPCTRLGVNDSLPPNTYRFNFGAKEAGTCTFTLSQAATPTHGAGPTKNVGVTFEVGQVASDATVPNVVNLGEATAQQKVVGAGLVAVIEYADVSQSSSVGKVLRQTPLGGEDAPMGSKVRLTVGKAAPSTSTTAAG